MGFHASLKTTAFKDGYKSVAQGSKTYYENMQVREELSWLQGCLISPISWRWKSGSLLKNDKVNGKTSFRAATHEVGLSLLKTILPDLLTTFVVSRDHLCFLLWKLRERCFINWALQIAVALDPWMPGATRIGQPVSLWPGWRICCIVDERVSIIFFFFPKSELSVLIGTLEKSLSL